MFMLHALLSPIRCPSCIVGYRRAPKTQGDFSKRQSAAPHLTTSRCMRFPDPWESYHYLTPASKKCGRAGHPFQVPQTDDITRMACPQCPDAPRRPGIGLIVGTRDAGWLL